nr:HlyC/CorC family transporter [Anaerolineae bacterium]
MNILLIGLIISILILLNGLFVAAEFAIIGVRASRIEQLSAQGNRTALWIRSILKDPRRTDRYIATSQLGITLASLGLGMYAEPSIAHIIEPSLERWFQLEGTIVHTIAFVIALTLITYLHVVVGEMVPKSLALQGAERVVLSLATPMRLASMLFHIPVLILNAIGLALLKLLRIGSSGENSRLHSADELALLVQESHKGGLVEDHERALVESIFDLGQRRVGQVMTPRPRMTALPRDIGESALLNLVTSSTQSRFPVYEGRIDRIVGMIHVKDVVRQVLDGKPVNIDAILRQVLYVPEAQRVEITLASFKRLHLHMAIVLDEFGGTAGLVTLEDLIEEVFGEMQDEFDTDEEPPIAVIGPGHLLVQGTVLLETLDDYLPVARGGHDVQTIGGLVMAMLDRTPEVGDDVRIGSLQVRVEEMLEKTIVRVAIRENNPEISD